MRFNALPESPALLQALLERLAAYLTHYLPDHRRIDRVYRVIRAPDRSEQDFLRALDEVARLESQHRDLFDEEPHLGEEFWEYVDWPFSWESDPDPGRERANFLAAIGAYFDRLAQGVDEATDRGESWFQPTLGLLQRLEKDIRDRLGRGAPQPAVRPAGLRSRSRKPFVPSEPQRRILEALNGEALRSEALAKVSKVSKSHMFKRYLPELRDRGLVRHVRRLGYYRPDAPPPGLKA